ncbi:hypothetical protein EDB89DRAFT_1840145 [Lactarius sanguifluus]|nr:hypothetical protein EDB89DRAFT_1840145 [Lactarius sanguifluus]
MWLKAYLNLSPTRPLWAIVTDILINAAAPLGTSAIARANTFIQTWEPPTQGPRAVTLGEDTIRMLKTAKKYKTNLAALRLSPALRAMLPAWYHPGAAPCPITNVASRCLLRCHEVKTVADLIKLARKIRHQNRTANHIPSLECVCVDCARDRLRGCRNPHACAMEAMTRTNDISPKYNPNAPDHHDNLSLTPNRKEKNRKAHETKGEVLFDPTITCKGGIAECFRIFTNPERITLTPACRQLTRGRNLEHMNIEVYTDGSCMKNGKNDASCGSGIWISDDHPQNRAVKVPGPFQSNQIGELVAVIAASESLPNYCKLTIITDSRYVIEGLTKHLV